MSDIAASSPKISILIPAFNEEAMIAGVIRRVHECFEVTGYPDYEIVVCDNHSTDQTAALATAAGARVVPEPFNQIARARNTAAKAATGEWFIFLDADTLLTPALLAGTIRALQSGKICAGGSTLKFDREDLGFFATLLIRHWNWISRTFQLAAGSYLFCHRQAWVDTGGFDETIYASEEIHFSRQLKKWGKQRGLTFRILTEAPVVTSARKMEWYSTGQLLWRTTMMMRPGATKAREKCDLWYTRPKS